MVLEAFKEGRRLTVSGTPDNSLKSSICSACQGFAFVCECDLIFHWRSAALQCGVVSAIHQHESAVGIHVSPPTSHPIPPLGVVTGPWVEHPESHRRFPLVLSVLHMVVYIFPCSPLSSSNHLLPLLRPQFFSLCLRLHRCPVHRFISTIFLDSTAQDSS